jgi:hypothetical protein
MNQKEVTPGGVIVFGGYDWRVLEVKDGAALLLSEAVLGEKPYNENYGSVTWAACSLRKYLNGDFYGKFDASEKSRITETRMVNDYNPWFGTRGGSDTDDRIFLLSVDETVKYFGDSGQMADRKAAQYWIDDEYNQARVALDARSKASWWWLRSPGYFSNYAAYVNNDGNVDVNGSPVADAGGGVRPALWLNLES